MSASEKKISNQNFTPDYHFCCNKKTSKEQRDKMFIGDIWINAAVCLKCKDYIRSLNKHDFRKCKCGAVAVDGGSHYARTMGNPEDMVRIIELFGENKI